VATSGRYHDSLIDIKERWTLKEVYDALDVIDLYERLAAKQADKQRDDMERNRRR
jgi:hypothetical protein